MNNLSIVFDTAKLEIVVMDGDGEVCRMPIGIAYWLTAALPKDGDYLRTK